MRATPPNFRFDLSGIADKLFSGIADKLFSVIAGKARIKRPPRIERMIRWFEKDGDALAGELRLDEVDLPKLQKLFNVPKDNPMYDCYPIKSNRQIQYIQRVTHHPVDSRSYDYFLECDAD